MSSDPYYSKFYAEGDNPPNGSNLKAWSFFLRHVPARSDQSQIIFDMTTSKVRATGEDAKNIKRLNSAMLALLPLLKDLQGVRSEVDDRITLLKSQASGSSKIKDIQAENLLFMATWMEQRCEDAFDYIVKLPMPKMAEAAVNFKPISTASFVKDMEVNAHIVRLIPHQELTPEICLRAVQFNPSALVHIPDTMKTPELCLTAMQVKENGVDALRHVPAGLRTKELCDAAVKSNYSNLAYVLEKTKDMCIQACLESGLAWDLIPKELRCLEVEYVTSLHQLGGRNQSMIYSDMEKISPETASSTADKLERAFVKEHYFNADENDLEDLGWPREFARG